MSATLSRQKWRLFKDKAAARGIAFGGISVILAIVVIFFYLLYVVLPLFKSADIDELSSYPMPGSAEPTLYLALEEQNEIGARLSADGMITFFTTEHGEVMLQQQLPIPDGTQIVSLASADPNRATVALGLSNGQALVFKTAYKTSFPNNVRVITPQLEYPLGRTPIPINPSGYPLEELGFEINDNGAAFASVNRSRAVNFVYMEKEESFLSDEVSFNTTRTELDVNIPVRRLLIDKDIFELYILGEKGGLSFYSLDDKTSPELVQHITNLDTAGKITDIRFLAGGISLLVATEKGRVSQWFPVRDEEGRESLTKIRSFDSHDSRISAITPEYNRKGFITIDDRGNIGIHHTTAGKTLLVEKINDNAIQKLAISPRASAFIAEDSERHLHFWHIDNEHPEVSFNSLWGKVWYESYDEPEYLWQSSSASNDFEPKFSLVPLSFGTLKAAFYAMLVAVPLAILGAIYTSQFMAPRMRQLVKPSIEIMEALPTVIIGFLAGLWLAPFIESELAGIFSILIFMPAGVILLAYAWSHWIPSNLRNSVPAGWEAALMVPGVLIIAYTAYQFGGLMETWFFGGDMVHWFSHTLGIPFDQRNSLVIGLAMGFAVIPTIFSIAEDALFAVPKHLINGSLALGATPWQTLVRVVLLTASPGIFSAVMIGLGRAVGETMIVLMATGNTPVMDFSIFQGMRTLSANIAVEMPESELNSTHYRVLFLAALVLFAFTFIFNTVAEIVRQRLRRKYSSL
ncbi:MAG: ABC transporter permease subunit [Gammaproteobacteria bacterium]|nr:ABC transporter permease subunit [Gammaproteobacteria bacterium]